MTLMNKQKPNILKNEICNYCIDPSIPDFRTEIKRFKSHLKTSQNKNKYCYTRNKLMINIICKEHCVYFTFASEKHSKSKLMGSDAARDRLLTNKIEKSQ